MKWYLDLDHTLYKTTFGYGQICRAASDIYKIRPLSFVLRMLLTRREFDFDGDIRHSSRLFHALKSCGIDDPNAASLIRNRLKGKDFLYPDAKILLDWLGKQGIKPTIITLGDVATQEFKISLIPSLMGFDRIVVQEPKQNYLKKLKKHDAIIVDDRPVNDLPLWCKGVLIARRPGEQYSGQIIKSLTELIK